MNDPQRNLHRWEQFRTAQRLGVRGIVPNPTAPTRDDIERRADQHRYGPGLLPATAEVRAWAQMAGPSLRQTISGEIRYKGRRYWLPSSGQGSASLVTRMY